jgi:hypothetical protein
VRPGVLEDRICSVACGDSFAVVGARLRSKVSGGAWTADSSITSVIAPQWDTTSGRIEMVIPRSALTSGAANDNSIVPITIALVRQNPTTSAWSEDDTITLRYKLTPASTPWIYGNVR